MAQHGYSKSGPAGPLALLVAPLKWARRLSRRGSDWTLSGLNFKASYAVPSRPAAPAHRRFVDARCPNFQQDVL
jgi:hypothetical protein